MKKILMITTGGTIACENTKDGLAPTSMGQNLMNNLDMDLSACEIDFREIMCVDSTDMTPKRMARIAETVFELYQAYDGFVVTHGTDTMAYSASMVSYMLKNLQKPLVFTGSQIPMGQEDTDALDNLQTALQFVVQGIPGVFIAFHGKIMDAMSTSKLYSLNYDAFHEVRKAGKRKVAKETALVYQPAFSKKVALLKLHPGISARLIRLLCQAGYEGIVVEGFGVGNIPGGEDSISQALIEASNQGLAVAISTQCLYDGTKLGVYEVSNVLTEYDMIDGGDMTTEALMMKMMWALGNFKSKNEVKSFIETPYNGDRRE